MKEFFRVKDVLVFEWSEGVQVHEVRYCDSKSHIWHFVNHYTDEDVYDEMPCDGTCSVGPEDQEVPPDPDIVELVKDQLAAAVTPNQLAT